MKLFALGIIVGLAAFGLPLWLHGWSSGRTNLLRQLRDDWREAEEGYLVHGDFPPLSRPDPTRNLDASWGGR